MIREQVEKLSAECAEAQRGSGGVRSQGARAVQAYPRGAAAGQAADGREGVPDVENRWWRDQARLLSELRDAGARIEALDTLRPFLATRIGSDATRRLEERFQKSRGTVDATAAITTFIAGLDETRDTLVPALERGERDDLVKGAGRDLPAGAAGDARCAGARGAGAAA